MWLRLWLCESEAEAEAEAEIGLVPSFIRAFWARTRRGSFKLVVGSLKLETEEEEEEDRDWERGSSSAKP